jgi:hypothetical protein
MAMPDRMLHLHVVVRRRARGRARRSKRRDRAGRGGRGSAHITQRILSRSLLAFHDTIIISSPLFFLAPLGIESVRPKPKLRGETKWIGQIG